MEQSLRVHVAAEVLPGPVLVTAEGRLTTNTYQRLFDVIAPALTLDGCPNITIELAAVTHSDHDVFHHLERYLSPHMNGRKAPGVTIQGVLSQKTTPDGAPHLVRNTQPAAPERTVGDVMSSVGPTVLASQMLGHAAHEIAVWAEPAVVIDASNQPLGIITEVDLQNIATDAGDAWRNTPCGRLVRTQQPHLQVTDSLEAALMHFQQDPDRPMLVLDGSEAAGILHPHTMFQWCAEHDVSDSRTEHPGDEGVLADAAPRSTKVFH